MGRLPATAAADIAAVFQGSKKGMAQERLPVGQQPIPVMGGNQGEGWQGLDRHRHSLARRADEKKPHRSGA